ncbi:MAG: papain-like cysteine protease family protein [Candidatus Saccharimonadales bacterium]
MSIAETVFPQIDRYATSMPGTPFDPYEQYIAQTRDLASAFRQARMADDIAVRHIDGPHYIAISRVLSKVARDLQDIHPDLTPEHLVPQSYQSAQALDDLSWRGRFNGYLVAISKIRNQKKAALTTLGIDLGRQVAKRSDTIVHDLSDTPYFRQGDAAVRSIDKPQKACFNACFRMVFAGITGVSLDEGAVDRAIYSQYQSSITADDQYLKVFGTETFNKLYNGGVQTLTVTGADLSTIQKIAAAYKRRDPNKRVFSIVSLSSEAGPSTVWHTNVLVGADETTVTTHDPSASEWGKTYKNIGKEHFYKRWALALNRAHIIVSGAPQS